MGNLGRNVYRTGNFSSVDFRLTRRIVLKEKRRLELSLDVFNLFNRVNIREADNSFTQAGRPVGAFDPEAAAIQRESGVLARSISTLECSRGNWPSSSCHRIPGSLTR